MEVIQKIIADSGLCSRRQAEEKIRKGQVKLNNKLAKLGDRGDVLKDKIMVQGRLIKPPTEKVYLKLNKPIEYVCTNKSFVGEKNIFSLFKSSARLFTIGRLDKDSRGLIILTNDGEVAQKLSHPKFEHEKIYVVKADFGRREEISFKEGQDICKKLKNGVSIGFGDGSVQAKKTEYLGNNSFKITLTEGKKRQIRRMFNALKLHIYDLKRTEFSGIKLDKLEEGKIRPLTEKEIKMLKK